MNKGRAIIYYDDNTTREVYNVTELINESLYVRAKTTEGEALISMKGVKLVEVKFDKE